MVGKTHLFVAFHHGLQGQPSNFTLLKETLETEARHFSKDVTLKLWDSKVNSWFKTFDGVEVCARRYTTELLSALVRWGGDACGTSTEAPLLLFSCVGHSLGGLILRFVVFLLVQDPLFIEKRIRLVSFVSIATPHCGVRDLSWFSRNVSALLAKCGSKAHADLLQHTRVLGETLLEPAFLRALASFQSRTLFASVNNDPFVSFRTSSLCFSLKDFPPRHDPLAEQLRNFFAEESSLANRHYSNRSHERCLPITAEHLISDVFRPPPELTTRLLHEVSGLTKQTAALTSHILPSFAIGVCSSSSTVAATPTPATTAESIAFLLLAMAEFVVVPVLSDAVLMSAHKSIIGASRFGRPLSDVMKYIAVRMLLEATMTAV
jgi:hypothetical protein